MTDRYRALSSYLSSHFGGDVETGTPLSTITWYKIGGPADYVVYPRTGEEAASILKLCASEEISSVILGLGANVLAHDAGYRGVVVSLTRYLNGIEFTNNGGVSVQAGAVLSDLIEECEIRGLAGLERLSGIPGTVGGALTMNAGTDEAEFGSVVTQVHLLGGLFDISTLERSEIAFGYRSAPQLQDRLLLDCTLQLSEATPEALREIRLGLLSRRAEKQPLEYPSCGSVFKRPPGAYVGKMVQECGLKGLRHGNAMISDKHCGFIVNLGGAKAEDVLHLIRTVQDTIHSRYQIQLEPEVRFVGFD